MRLTIHKGKHRPAWSWLQMRLWFKKRSIRKVVSFSFNCKYDLKSKDQHDTNKLFGIGYFPNHHKESARFGWRYDNAVNRFVISAYCYVSGKRVIEQICSVVANHRYKIQLDIFKDHYLFIVSDFETPVVYGSKMIPFKHKKKFGFPLGLYFGGNNPAPHEMTIEMKKL